MFSFSFLAILHSMQDASSLTRDWTYDPCSGSTEQQATREVPRPALIWEHPGRCAVDPAPSWEGPQVPPHVAPHFRWSLWRKGQQKGVRKEDGEKKQRIEVKPEAEEERQRQHFGLGNQRKERGEGGAWRREDAGQCHRLTCFFHKDFLSTNPFCSQQLHDPSYNTTLNRSKFSMTSCGPKSLALHLNSPCAGPNLPSQTHLPLSCL